MSEEMMQALMMGTNACTIMPNPYFERMKNKRDEFVDSKTHEVQWQIFVPIPICEGSPWPPNSRCLADCRYGLEHQPLVDLVQLLFLGTNMGKNGTPSFGVSPQSNPGLYNRVLVAYCKKLSGIAKPGDVKLLERYEKNSPYFDPAVAAKIKSTLLSITNKEQDDPNDDPNNNDGNEDDSDDPLGPAVIHVSIPPVPSADSETYGAWMETVRTWLNIHKQKLNVLTQLQREFFLSHGGSPNEFDHSDDNNNDGNNNNNDNNNNNGDKNGGNKNDEIDLDVVERWCDEYLMPISVCAMETSDVVRDLVAREFYFSPELRAQFSVLPMSAGSNMSFPGRAPPLRRCWPVGTDPDERPPIIIDSIVDDTLQQSILQRDVLSSSQGGTVSNNGISQCSVPKVHATLMVVPPRVGAGSSAASGNKKSHLLLRFSVLDPNWSLKKLVGEIEHNMYHATKGEKKSGMQQRRVGGAFAVDPFESLRRFRDTHIANTYNEQRFLNIVGYFRTDDFTANVAQTYVCGDVFDDMNNPFHLSKHVTLRRSLDMLEHVGGNINPFLGLSNNLAVPISADFYILNQFQMFWSHPKKLGFGHTAWPHEPARENFALELVLRELIITNNGKTIIKRNNAGGSAASVVVGKGINGTNGGEAASVGMQKYANRHLLAYPDPVVDKRLAEARSASLLNYRTAEQIMIWQAENDRAIKILHQYLPEDPRAEPDRYDTFCGLMDRMRRSALDKFLSIWTTDGIVDNKPIDTSYKEVLKALHATLRTCTTLTVKTPAFDPLLTVYGNNCVMRMLLIKNGASVFNCIIPFTASALLSTFDAKREGKVKVNIQLCGPKEAGKTFPLIGFITKNFINGTFQLVQTQSARADNVDMHIGPGIILIDEPPLWFNAMNEKSEKDYERIQEMKNRTVNHQNSRTVLDTQEVDGVNVRFQKKIVTDDARTIGICTNQPRNKVTALSSRFFQITVPKPTNPCDNSDATGSATLTCDTRTFFVIDEILIVEVYTALRIGVIPDIDMWLSLMVTGRCIDILKSWGVLDRQKGERARQIVLAFIRHQIIIRGVAACCHTPGGALYDVPYRPEDVISMAPYFVCTLEICLVALNMLGSELIDDDASVVFKAACRLADFDWRQSAFQNYKLNHKIRFKHEIKRTVVDAGGVDNRKRIGGGSGAAAAVFNINVVDSDPVIDLNYLTFRGSMEKVCADIAAYTKPALETAQVRAVLESLKDTAFPSPGGLKYSSMAESFIMKAVRFDGSNEQAEEDLGGGDRVFYTEKTLKEPCKTVSPVIYLEDKKMLFLAPALIEACFNVDAIEHAFNVATVCASHPVIKAIKGLTHKGHGDLFRTCNWTKEWIKNFVEKIDKEVPDAQVLRKDGIGLTSAGFMSEMERDMILSIRPDPGRATHYEDYVDVVTERSESYVKIVDWEKTAAERVVFRCGIPRNQWIFYTDAECKARYLKYVETHKDDDAVTANMDYPYDIMRDRKKDREIKAQFDRQMSGALRESSESLFNKKQLHTELSKDSVRVHKPRSSKNIKKRVQPVTADLTEVPIPPPKEKEEEEDDYSRFTKIIASSQTTNIKRNKKESNYKLKI